MLRATQPQPYMAAVGEGQKLQQKYGPRPRIRPDTTKGIFRSKSVHFTVSARTCVFRMNHEGQSASRRNNMRAIQATKSQVTTGRKVLAETDARAGSRHTARAHDTGSDRIREKAFPDKKAFILPYPLVSGSSFCIFVVSNGTPKLHAVHGFFRVTLVETPSD